MTASNVIAMTTDTRPPGTEAPAAKAKKKGGGKDKKPLDFGTLQMMLQRFVLLYGTTTVWDDVNREIYKIEAIAAAYPDYIRAWKSHPARKQLNHDRVVFDPTGEAAAPDYINLYDGLPLNAPPAPKVDAVKPALELLGGLCSGDATLMAWLLRWCALPLQKPGTKMATAVLMHGEEGTGKNLFWSILERIYGRYAVMIGQEQLDSKYNGWASRKLLVIGNEVLTPQERLHNKGRLRLYITEPTINIEDKFLPMRTERNSMNLVFLSNEDRPLSIDPGDRRYCVVWTPTRQPAAFYERVRAWLDDGGAEAFFGYLLALDLTGFEAHTKPPMTAAKANLIELNKPSTTLFIEAWRDGMTPLPWGTVRSNDAYDAYKLWCSREGQQHPKSLVAFSAALARYMDKAVGRYQLADGVGVVQQSTLFEPRDPPPPYGELTGAERYRAVGREIAAFTEKMDEVRKGVWVVRADAGGAAASGGQGVPL